MVTRPNRRDTPIPLHEPTRPSHNLPLQPSPLLGRDDDIAGLRHRILNVDTRLITLTGPPGTGKTRLGIAVADSVVDDFGDGVWFVPLETVRDPNAVISAIAGALGVRDDGTQPLEDI